MRTMISLLLLLTCVVFSACDAAIEDTAIETKPTVVLATQEQLVNQMNDLLRRYEIHELDPSLSTGMSAGEVRTRLVMMQPLMTSTENELAVLRAIARMEKVLAIEQNDWLQAIRTMRTWEIVAEMDAWMEEVEAPSPYGVRLIWEDRHVPWGCDPDLRVHYHEGRVLYEMLNEDRHLLPYYVHSDRLCPSDDLIESCESWLVEAEQIKKR